MNFPKQIPIHHNLQRIGVDPLGMIAALLRAEHKHRVKELWKKQIGKYKYKFDPDLTTPLHFLYRLRVKSNYREIDLFVSEAPPNDILEFANSLKHITSSTLTLIEVVLLKRYGTNIIYSLAREYLSINPKALSLNNRLSIYKN